MLETVETRFAVAADRAFPGAVIPAFELLGRLIAKKKRVAFHAPEGRADGPVVVPAVNHSRWLAKCPFCASSQHASEDGLFYCAICSNEAGGHRTIPLAFPVNAGEIASVLKIRPLPEQRNWNPGESIDDLRRQDLFAIREGRLSIG